MIYNSVDCIPSQKNWKETWGDYSLYKLIHIQLILVLF
jgi:hypothetical protein